MKKLLATFVALLLASASAQAADVYKFDVNHTNITWWASHFGFSSPSGKFTGVDGSITLDEVKPQNSKVEITIKIDSLSTGLPKFDNHLKSEDFFDEDKFPTAKFVSTTVTPTSRTTAKVVGNLTLRGITKVVTLDVKLNKIAVSEITQKKTAGFTVNTTIKRSQFGMEYGIPGVSDNIKINIEAEGTLTSSNSTSTSSNTTGAQGAAWKIVQNQSKIEFKADQENSKISGSFSRFEGNINFDPQKLSSSNVMIEIDTTSASTNFSDAIDTMKSAAWLSVNAFPKAIFKSKSFALIDGKSKYRSQGTLTLKGKTIPVTLDFTLQEYTASHAHITGNTNLKRSDFNIGDRDLKKANGVKENVLVMIDVVAER